MKNIKNISILVAIAVCTLILSAVAFPALLTGASADADAYTLGIYGNANEDDTIDMRDFTHTARIICWLEEETTLADANYDGEIDVGDMTQVGLIILGRESELTIVDAMERDVTIHKPVNRIVCMSCGIDLEVLRALNAKEKAVGVDSYVVDREVFFPELSKLPCVSGGYSEPDYEAIFALDPDLVILFGGWAQPDESVKAGITAAGLMFAPYGHEDPKERSENVAKLGYIVDKEDEAKEFIDFIQDSEAELYEMVKELVPEEEDRPKVYIEGSWSDYITSSCSRTSRLCRLAGGRPISDELDLAFCVKVSPEWVIEQNPDIIFKMMLSGSPYAPCPAGYATDDPSGMKELRDEIMNRPELANVKAVKTGQVYVMTCFGLRPASCTGIPYMAKAIYPDLFSDLDTNEIHQQEITEFQGLDFDLDEHGVFIYHPVYFPEGR